MTALKIEEILNLIPHRFPMLLVDRILELDLENETCKGLKNVSMNEAFFQGHYPGAPIMPGVLILEAMAQVGSVLILSMEQNLGMVPLIGGIENAKFRRMVVPGDQMIIDTQLLWMRSSVGKFKGVARVEGDIAVEMEMTFKLLAREK